MNCKNGEAFLSEAIDSVYDQTYKNWEIIFWDNISTDSSAKIAQSYDHRIKYFLAKKATPLGEARNLALNEASGKYVCFLDCDDIYLPKKLEKQVEMMEKDKYVMGYGSALIINKDNKVIKSIPTKNRSGFILKELLNHYEINMQSVILLNSYLKEKKLNFMTNMKYCPDHNMFMKIASKNKIGVQKDFIVKYRILKNSLSIDTIHLAGAEVRLTLDHISLNLPKLKNSLKKEFENAYSKCIYYESIAAIYVNNYFEARKLLRPLINLKYEYLFLYIILFIPLHNRLILRLLNRHI